MVDTVLSRDKNWIRWKLENCPIITRVPLPSDSFSLGANGAKSACAGKRMRATPMGSLDLKFLSDAEDAHGLDASDFPSR